MNVVFRVDSSVQIGSGHLMRCLTLAEQLQTKGIIVYFVCRILEGNLIELIQKQNFQVLKLPPISHMGISDLDWYKENWRVDAQETLYSIRELYLLIDLLIVDHYGLDEQWETMLNNETKKLMVIDDLANRTHQCDILLDQNFYLNIKNRYNKLVPINCRLLLGPNYILLREEFKRMSNNLRVRDGQLKNILVFFGGTDPTNETMKALDVLSQLNIYNVNVVVGTSNLQKDKIRKYCLSKEHFNFHCQISNMAELMNNADISIGAGGTTTWERCYLGLPSLTVMVADNQVEITKAVEAYGATINLGYSNNRTSENILNSLTELLENPKMVVEMSNRSLQLVNPIIVNSMPVLNTIMEELV